MNAPAFLATLTRRLIVLFALIMPLQLAYGTIDIGVGDLTAFQGKLYSNGFIVKYNSDDYTALDWSASSELPKCMELVRDESVRFRLLGEWYEFWSLQGVASYEDVIGKWKVTLRCTHPGTGESATKAFNFTLQASDLPEGDQERVRILGDSLPAAPMGERYSIALSELGVEKGDAPYTWLVWGDLPPGLRYEERGQAIIGTPLEGGLYDVHVQVLDTHDPPSDDNRDGIPGNDDDFGVMRGHDVIIPLRVFSNEPLAIATERLLPSWEGADFAQLLEAQGGLPPYDWTLSSGFPSGLSINPQSMEISGEPAIGSAGAYSISLVVTDDFDQLASVELDFVVYEPIAILTSSLPSAIVAEYYVAPIEASGGSGNYRWTLGGALPDGLTFSRYGEDQQVFGTVKPEADGTTFNFGVTVADAENPEHTRTTTLSIEVFPAGSAPLRMLTTFLPAGQAGEAYAPLELRADGGEPEYQWSQTGLPSGLSLAKDSSGRWKTLGNPDAAGTYSVTLTLSDQSGDQDTAITSTFTLVIQEPVVDEGSEAESSPPVVSSNAALLAGGAPAAGCAMWWDDSRPSLTLWAFGVLVLATFCRSALRRAAASNA